MRSTTASGLFALAALTACSSPAPGPATAGRPSAVRIGYQAIPNAELVAKQLGWYEEALKVPIEWRQFESGRDVNTAIAAGGIDIGLVGSGAAATGLARGLPYRVIALYDVIGKSESLVAKPPLARLTDLRGHKVAAPFGSTTHYSLLQALRLAGLSASDVTLLDLNPPDLLAAWTRGDIDAAYVWQPTLQRLYESGAVRLTGSDELALRGVPTFDVAVARREFLEQHPDLAGLYVETLSRAVELYRRAPAQATDAIARELRLGAREAADQAEGLLWLNAAEQLAPEYFGPDGTGGLATALEATARFLVEQKVISEAPNLAAYRKGTDSRFLRLAAKH